MTRHIVIGEGPSLPKEKALDIFWAEARAAVPDLSDDHQVRSIGIDEETTGLIMQFINAGTKVGTFSLPWMMEAEGYPETKPGTPIILTAYDGTPQAVIRIGRTWSTTFGSISENETRLDGPPVQDLNVWKPLHRQYWNGLMSKYGKSCTDDMPIIVEPFELVYSASKS